MTLTSIAAYPEKDSERDHWILARRGPRAPVQAALPYAFVREQECFENGEVGDIATIFLTNQECPWRCAMCDLWRHTLTHPVGVGDIPRQIDFALERIPGARQIKLYNSGSFFDVKAIPREDYPAIASQVQSFERVIVESHPALIGDNCLQLAKLLDTQLEVAMGLETAHPVVLEKLNKRMTIDQYAAAAGRLQKQSIALRSFVLVQPPFLPSDLALEWACRSIDFAQDCGATVVILIPTRAGNGATDELALAGEFSPPPFAVLEKALDYGIGRSRCRVFVDLWDIERLAGCLACRTLRISRLVEINLSQRSSPPVECMQCEGRA